MEHPAYLEKLCELMLKYGVIPMSNEEYYDWLIDGYDPISPDNLPCRYREVDENGLLLIEQGTNRIVGGINNKKESFF